MQIDLAVFDIAGTTVYDGDAVHRCLADAVRSGGVSPSREAINRVMGMPKPIAIARLVEEGRGTQPDPAEVERLYRGFERAMIEYYRTSPDVRETDGASQVLRWLRRNGVVVVLDTGFARPVTAAIVERLGWADEVVDFTVSTDEVPNGRPHPDMIFLAMERAGVSDPARVVKVGDTPADLREGTAAGCGFVVGITTGSHARDELAAHPHTHLIESLRELPPLVDGTFAERAAGDASEPLLFTPGPLTTSRGVKTAMLRDLGSRDRAFIDLVARLRTRLRAIVTPTARDQYETVLVQGSGTYAVEAMIGTLVPRSGRLLVLDNGAYGRRLAEIADALAIPSTVRELHQTEPIDPREVEAALAADPDATHVAAVHCETTTGLLNPVRSVGAAVRAAGRTFLVDAMSSFGAVPIDLDADHVDAVAASSNKCLEGVPGCSFVVARRALLESGAGRGLALDLSAQWRGFERDGQFRFTPPTHVLLALDRALDEFDREGGVAGRAARYRANRDRLLSGTRSLGFEEVIAPDHQSDVITTFRCPADPAFVFADFYERLRARHFVIYPGKLARLDSFRIGTIGRLYPQDFDALVDAICEVLAAMDVRRLGADTRSPLNA